MSDFSRFGIEQMGCVGGQMYLWLFIRYGSVLKRKKEKMKRVGLLWFAPMGNPPRQSVSLVYYGSTLPLTEPPPSQSAQFRSSLQRKQRGFIRGRSIKNATALIIEMSTEHLSRDEVSMFVGSHAPCQAPSRREMPIVFHTLNRRTPSFSTNL